MRKLTHTSNKKTILLTMSILLFTIGTLSIQQSIAVTPADPLLEDLLIDSILNMYQTSPASPSVGGFGSYDYIDWQDTLEGLGALAVLNGSNYLSNDQRDAISKYLQSQRSVVDDGNNSFLETWWGTVRRSVEALRMSQLIDRLDSAEVALVEQQVIDIYRSEGLHLKIGSEGWEEGYWGIAKAREWHLFDVMDEMYLPLFTMEALNVLSSSPVVVSDNYLSQKDVTLEWIPAQTQIVSPVSSAGVTTYELTVPTLAQVSSVGDPYRSYPDFSLTITTDMLDGWNESDFDQTNFENSTYGQEHGLLNTYVAEVPYLITNADGSNRTIYQTEQVSEWDYSSLQYLMNVSITTPDGGIVEEMVINLQNPSLGVLHVDNMQMNDMYIITTVPYQVIHVEEEVINSTNWRESNYPLSLEVPVVSVDYQAVGVGTIITLDDGTNYLNTSDGYSYRVWAYPTSMTESWSELVENPEYRLGLLDRGYGSLSITSNQSQFYNVLMFPMGSEDRLNQATTNYMFDGTLESYEVTRNYLQVEDNYIKYQDLVNGSVGTLDAFYEHVDMISSLSLDVPVEDLMDADAVLFKTFFNYNQTNNLFDNSWERTLQTWQLLDSFDLTSQVFTRSEYETVLMSYFNRTYQEAQDQEGNVVAIVIDDEKDTTTDRMQDTYLFTRLLTYNESWISQTHVVGVRALQTSLDPTYIGFAVLPKVEKKTEYELIMESQDEFFIEMYVQYGTDLGTILDKYTPQIQLRSSRYMASHLMHWLDLSVRSPVLIDYLIHFGVGIFAVLCVLVGSFDNFTHRRLLIGLITGLVIIVQALSTPILQSGFTEGILELAQASVGLVKMLEDGIYDISAELGGISNRIFAKPVDYPINPQSTGTLQKEVTRVDNQTIEDAYLEYTDEFNEIQTRWRRLYRLDGTTMNYQPYIQPLTMVEFIRELATTSISQFAIFKLVEKELENQIDVDRADQRAFAISSFARAIIKGGQLTAKGLGLVGITALRGLYTKVKAFLSAISPTKWAGYVRGYKKLLMSNLQRV